MTTQLQTMPAVAPAMIAALTTVRRRPDESTPVPDLATRIDGVSVNPRALAAYRTVCGFDSTSHLPVSYPQVLVAPIHLQVMNRKGFPIPLLGMVHLRNSIEQLRPIEALETLSFSVDVGQLRRVKMGLEIDVNTECRGKDDEAPAWRSTMTILHRIKEKNGGGFRKPPGAPASLVESQNSMTIDIAEDTGRRYAKVAGDYNPIHLHALSAKLFGFKRAIAHGMWTQARCCAELERACAQATRSVDIEFKRPIFLPGKATLKWAEGEAGIEYGLLGRNASEVHVLGHLQAGLR
ncbi:MAG: hypothetical protein K0U79_06415 [Gammaproteobacteria bacterium]|nr:hypothetical protein [Gammaproteobacteria bacterium]